MNPNIFKKQINDKSTPKFTSIDKINEYLVGMNKYVLLKEYIIIIRNNFHMNIKLELIIDLFNMVYFNYDFTLDSSVLNDYELVDFNTKDIPRTVKYLESQNLKEGVDFKEFKLDFTNKKNIKIRPAAFKYILMKEPKYREYYLFLEKCFYYYDKYQLIFDESCNQLTEKIIEETKEYN